MELWTYILIWLVFMILIVLLKKRKDGPNSRFWNFRNCLVLVLIWIAVQFIWSSSYAFTLQELSTNNFDWNSVYWYCLNNDCYWQIVSNWCYNRIDYQWNRFYNTNTNSCASPTVSYGFNRYPDYWGGPYDMFEAYIDIPNGPEYQIPWVSFGNDWEGGLKFGFLRSSEGIIYYSVASNTAFTLDYQWTTHTITNAFFSPSSIVFYSNDWFFYQVSAGGYIGDWFFAINPNLSTDNVFFVRPSINKAWSYTFNQSDAWLYLLWEDAIPSINDIPFNKSYTLTRWGSSFYPTNFYTYPQTSNDDWIIYSLDLEFTDIPSDNTNTWSNDIYVAPSVDFNTCVWKYWTVSNLAQQLQILENNISLSDWTWSYSYTTYQYILERITNFDWLLSWSLDVQINNYTLDKTLVSAVNNVWIMSQESPHAYLYYLNQAISNKTSPWNIISTYCWTNPDSQVNTSLISALEGVLDAQWNVICKTYSGANVYQNDLEKIIWSYNYYKVRCDNNIYAPTPYDNWTWSVWSLKSFWSWVQSGVSNIFSENTNNTNVCAYADYLGDLYYSFLGSVDCSTCNQSYITSLQHDYQADICNNPEELLENSTQINADILSWTIIDPTNDNVSRMAWKLLDTFKTPYMSWYRAIITPTCYYWKDYERANYFLYGVFAVYIYILFKLLH